MRPIQDARTFPTLEFHDGQPKFKMVTEAGTNVERLISWAAVREAATAIAIDSGWLSPAIVRWGTGAGGDWCVTFNPPARYKLELTHGEPGPDEQIERIIAPLPGLVMFGMAMKYWVWAVREPQLDPRRELFRCPTPNVMADGSICWGALKPPQANAGSMARTLELFFGSTFNFHAANAKSRRFNEDVRLLLKELSLQDDSVYPVDDLIRQVEHGVTLDTAVRHLFGTGEFPS